MKTKYKIASLLFGVACTVLTIPVWLNSCKESTSADMIYITAAHIPEDSIVGYTLMYKDTSRDTAYYLKDDYQYSYPEIGDVVFFGNTKGVVTGIKDGVGFYVKPDDSSAVYKGMSGARVRNSRGEEIAFISSSKSVDKLLCVSIK